MRLVGGHEHRSHKQFLTVTAGSRGRSTHTARPLTPIIIIIIIIMVRKLQHYGKTDNEIHNLGMRWISHEELKGKMRNAYIIVVGGNEGYPPIQMYGHLTQSAQLFLTSSVGVLDILEVTEEP
jgi:hypothetical protein